MIIKLNSLDGYQNPPVFINSDHIIQLRNLQGFTEVVLTEKRIIAVSDSAESIMDIVNSNLK